MQLRAGGPRNFRAIARLLCRTTPTPLGRIVHVVKVRFTETQLYTLDHLVSKLRVARRGRKAGYPIRLVLIYGEESVMAMRERQRNLDADGSSSASEESSNKSPSRSERS